MVSDELETNLLITLHSVHLPQIQSLLFKKISDFYIEE